VRDHGDAAARTGHPSISDGFFDYCLFDVVILARDSASSLGACLESVAGCPVVVAVDTRSSDATSELARASGARVEHVAWQGGFGAQRNEAGRLASHDWVFFLDADERASQGLLDEIRTLLSEGPKFAAYSCPRRNTLLGRRMEAGGWWPDRQIRLINRLEASYSGVVNETVDLP